MTDRHADPSGARARTLLAWSRTSMTAFGLSAVAVRGLPNDFAARWWIGLTAAMTAVAAEAYGYRAYSRPPDPRTRRHAARLLTGLVALLAAGALLVNLT